MGSFAASTRRLAVIAGLVVITVPATAAAGQAASSRVSTARSAAVASGGTYQALAPSRILDTGSGIGAPKAAVKAHATLALSVLGHGGVPSSGVGAVVLNVTAASPTASGYVTVYPAGAARPGTSNLNFTAGTAVANLVVIKVGSGGLVDLDNGSAGTLRLVADVEGYYAAGAAAAHGAFTPLTPARVLDTGAGVGATKRPLPAHGTVTLSALGHGGLPSTGVGAVVLNVTVASPTSAGYLTVFPSGDPRPTASNLNFVRAQVVPNLVVVKVGSAGRVSLYNSSAGTVRLVADVEGYYLSGDPTEPGALAPLSPARVLDTSAGIGATAGLVAPQATVALSVLGHGGIPVSGVGAVVLNLTAASPAASGYLTAYPAGGSRPGTSNLNFVHSATRANLVIVPVGAGGVVELFNGSGGKVRLIADVEGYFLTTPPASLSWTTSSIDPPLGDIESISCPTVQKCVAVDAEGDVMVETNGTWTYPSDIGPSLRAISCPTTTFCAAAGPNSIVTYDGSTWTTSKTFDPSVSFIDISCPSTSFCAAVDVNGLATTYNGSTWTAASSATSTEFRTVSCASATMCLALDEDGDAIRYDGSSWSAATSLFGHGSNAPRIDCPTTTFCAAVAQNDAATYNGATWSTPVSVVGSQGLIGLSCASAAYCVSMDANDGSAWVLSGGTTWSNVTGSSGLDPAAVSCVTTTYCVLAGGSLPNTSANAVNTFNGTTWSTLSVIDQYNQGKLNSVSCPTTTFCVAVDASGFVLTYNGSTWTRPAALYPQNGFNDVSIASVSCPTTGFCLAVTSDGHSYSYNGSTWSTRAFGSFYGFLQVSCSSPSFCVAIDNTSRATTYDGSSWAPSQVIDPSTNDLSSISCPTDGHCFVTDGNGNVVTLQGTTWNAPTPIDPADNYLNAISCPTATDCTAMDDQGNAVLLSGATWAAPVLVDSGEYVRSISCVGPATCQAVDQGGHALPIENGIPGALQEMGTANQVESVSCATATFCVAVDQLGQASVGD